jgi:hypothetical protein
MNESNNIGIGIFKDGIILFIFFILAFKLTWALITLFALQYNGIKGRTFVILEAQPPTKEVQSVLGMDVGHSGL